MCQNVKRRLVVRSNDDRRHSTMIFSENFAIGRSGEKKKTKTKTKTKQRQKENNNNNNNNNNREAFRDEYCFWEYAKKYISLISSSF